jgi:phosphoenolpyruvate synthase/pyruvate phosphate dikinase|tara:strand:+ start:721 stop:1062 length:342 start_codon:yes stop_codon:yes gene_type:complete
MNKQVAVSKLITDANREKLVRVEQLKKELRQLEKDLNKDLKPALRKIANGEELEFSNDDIEIKITETKEIVSVKPKSVLEIILSDKQKEKVFEIKQSTPRISIKILNTERRLN